MRPTNPAPPALHWQGPVDLRSLLGTSRYLALGLAVTGLIAALGFRPAAAHAAANQDWPPFVLVAGLLLIGLVADDDRLFAAGGQLLAKSARNGFVLFVGAATVIGAVTALLNLDTSVAFLTPVLVDAARNRGSAETPLLYGCLLLSNAASLFLPGSNLTNLIVLGHAHLAGSQFLGRMWAHASAKLLVTGLAVAALERRTYGRGSSARPCSMLRPSALARSPSWCRRRWSSYCVPRRYRFSASGWRPRRSVLEPTGSMSGAHSMNLDCPCSSASSALRSASEPWGAFGRARRRRWHISIRSARWR